MIEVDDELPVPGPPQPLHPRHPEFPWGQGIDVRGRPVRNVADTVWNSVDHLAGRMNTLSIAYPEVPPQVIADGHNRRNDTACPELVEDDSVPGGWRLCRGSACQEAAEHNRVMCGPHWNKFKLSNRPNNSFN